LINNNLRISIEGHTNNIGSTYENQILSELRSKSVYDYLIFQNVKETQLSYIGFGESKPLYSNDNKEGRVKNRRTSFRIQ
jgi:outer membrane protein OmpA-like peptidoglycan-associated protein